MSEYSYIVFYDGVCGLCNRSVQSIIKRDKKEIFRFATLDSELARLTLINLQGKLRSIDSIVLYAENKTFIYSDAIMEIISLLGYPYKLLLVFKIVPKSFRDWLYKWIARNRYKIWGEYDSCPIPTENQRKLFLDNR